MLIDCHTHAFPDTLAQRAVSRLSYTSGGMVPHTDGTVSDLKRQMKEQGVDCSVVMNIATNAHQMHAVNDFAASVAAQNTDIIPFGSVHPEAPDAIEELDRIASMGIKGVKFHPEYQHFYVDEDRMIPLYRRISQLGLIVAFHAGTDFGFLPPYHAMPQNIAAALKYLDTAVIAAHWGGMECGETVLGVLAGLPLYFDVSLGYGTMPREMGMRIVEKHGYENLLFGSDSPWHSPEEELRYLNTLELGPTERDAIFYKNACRLFGR